MTDEKEPLLPSTVTQADEGIFSQETTSASSTKSRSRRSSKPLRPPRQNVDKRASFDDERDPNVHYQKYNDGQDPAKESGRRSVYYRFLFDDEYFFARSLTIVFLYFLFGIVFYSVAMSWAFIDSFYFCVVTLTTVGYGDMTPVGDFAKLFTCFYVLGEIILISGFLGQLFEKLIDGEVMTMIKTVKEKSKRFSTPDVLTEEETPEERKRRRKQKQESIQEAKNEAIRQRQHILTTTVTIYVAIMVVGVLVFHYIQHLSLVDALYLVCMSTASVGYGDFSASERSTRVFCIVWLLAATLGLAKVVSDLTRLNLAKKAAAQKEKLLQERLLMDAYLQTDLDQDGKIDKCEYLAGILVRLGKTTKEEVREILNQFEVLDVDQSGFLDFEEVGSPMEL